MDVLPKIADVKTLKDLSKILIYPMLIAAFIVQTGLTLSLGSIYLEVSQESPVLAQSLNFLLIFALKAAFISLITGCFHWLILYVHIITHLAALRVISVLFLAFGFIGIFAGDGFVFLNTLNKMWFYTAFVIGFYCLASATDIEEF